MMLYLFDRERRQEPIAQALRATEYDVVSTGSVTQAMALLFLMHTVVGVVVDEAVLEANPDLVKRLHGLSPQLPIVGLINSGSTLPSGMNAVSIAQPPEAITAAVERGLTSPSGWPTDGGAQPSQESAA
jgi:DNA-binding NtrC family response regulator